MGNMFCLNVESMNVGAKHHFETPVQSMNSTAMEEPGGAVATLNSRYSW